MIEGVFGIDILISNLGFPLVYIAMEGAHVFHRSGKKCDPKGDWVSTLVTHIREQLENARYTYIEILHESILSLHVFCVLYTW